MSAGTVQTVDTLESEARAALAAGELDLPLPMERTAQRMDALREWGARDLAFAKVAEAHADAVGILAEAGREPVRGALYAVWASASRGTGLRARRVGSHVELEGQLRFASGANFVDRALVTARNGADVLLVDLALTSPGLSVQQGTWNALGMGRVGSPDVTVEAAVDVAELVGPPNWYLQRHGFWVGGIGVAAVWLGALEALMSTFRDQLQAHAPTPHELAHFGACGVITDALRVCLNEAVAQVVAAPTQDHLATALSLRTSADWAVDEVVRRMGRALGPVPLVRDREHAQRVADLVVWVRQCHAETDLETLGTLALKFLGDTVQQGSAGG